MEDEQTDKHIDELTGRVGRFEGSVKERFDQVDHRFDRFEGEVNGRFERSEGDVKDEFAKVHARFDKVDTRFDKVDTRFDKVDTGHKELGAKIDKMTRLLTSGLVTVVGAVIIKVFLS